MRRSRIIFGIFAVISILLNAALVVRQNSTMLGARFEHASLLAALGVICRADGSSALPAGERSDLPPIAPNSGDCPVCMGMCPAVTVLPDLVQPQLAIDAPSARVQVVAAIIRKRIAAAWPLPRGSPAIL